jgi:hypothetical protein
VILPWMPPRARSPSMIAFHSVLPEIARREVRCIQLGKAPDGSSAPGLSAGEYAFVEFYCEDLNCDCRRTFIQVIARDQRDRVLASINYGWEDESFYRQRMPYDPDAPAEIVRGSLDLMNAQSEHSAALLELFQRHVLDEPYRLRLRRHYQQCRDELHHRQDQPATFLPDATSFPAAPTGASPSESPSRPIPAPHCSRFNEVAALLAQFGQAHLDAELTGFTVELWRRICRKKSPDCLRGQPGIWAAAVIHVIARMNFLFDRSQPVHLSFDTICAYFQTNKTTIGSKATTLERTLKLRPHSEPGLCRSSLLESFTTVRLSNGMVLSFEMAKRMGYLPPGATPADLA